MNDAEEEKLRVDEELREKFSWMDEFAWALLLRKPEELGELTKAPFMRSVPVFAKQVRIDDVYKRSIDLLDKVPDMPFGAMTQKKLKEATGIFEETCRDIGCFEGVANRYQEIASLVPESFERVENTFVNDIEKINKKNYGKVEGLMYNFREFLKKYNHVINAYSKVNEKYWKRRRAGMKKEDADKFLETIYIAGNKLRGGFESELSKKRIKIAARRKYVDLVTDELGGLEDYFGELSEEALKKSKEYLLDLAEKFDDIPKTGEEVTKGPAGMPVELHPILETLFGRLERYNEDPKVYKGAFHKSSIAMDKIRNTNWFDYGRN